MLKLRWQSLDLDLDPNLELDGSGFELRYKKTGSALGHCRTETLVNC
jgi:hypothetical protein